MIVVGIDRGGCGGGTGGRGTCFHFLHEEHRDEVLGHLRKHDLFLVVVVVVVVVCVSVCVGRTTVMIAAVVGCGNSGVNKGFGLLELLGLFRLLGILGFMPLR